MKEFNYKINGAPYRVVVTKSDSELVELEVNGTPYTVEMAPKAKKTESRSTAPKCSGRSCATEFIQSSRNKTCRSCRQEHHPVPASGGYPGYPLQSG